MNRKLKISLSISFIIMLALYMVCSFMFMDFNVCNWTEDARGAVGIFWFGGSVFACVPLLRD